MEDDTFIMCIGELVEKMNNLSNTLKCVKEDLHYITEMMEDDRHGIN